MTHYNTGDGIQFHHKGARRNVCQTFDTISNIPSSSFKNLEALIMDLDALAASRYRDIKMKEVYNLLRMRLGKAGTRAPASIHPEDYEAVQTSGTCSMQCLMAMMRHQVMQMNAGSPQERKAIYDHVKLRMLQQFYRDNRSEIDETIQKNLPTVLAKLDAKQSLCRLAENAEIFNEALKLLIQTLDYLGEPETANTLRQKDQTTNFSRYAILTHASNTICSLWLRDSQKVPEGVLRQNPCFQYAIAKFENSLLRMNHIKIFLEKSKDDLPKLASDLSSLLYRTPFTDFLISEAVARLGEDKKPYPAVFKFLDSLNSRRPTTEDVAVSFIKGLRAENHSEIADWAAKKWKDLESKKTKRESFD